jgi:50S ribosomal subunit-associated GTPase HflX
MLSAAVHDLLDELHLGSIPRIIVYNKADLVEPYEARILARKAEGVAISAETKLGLERLVSEIAHRLWQTEVLPEDDAWAAEARSGAAGPAAPSKAAAG